MSQKVMIFFAKSIIRILNEFKSWKAFSLGDEDRRKNFIKHKNHYELGFLKHKKSFRFIRKNFYICSSI